MVGTLMVGWTNGWLGGQVVGYARSHTLAHTYNKMSYSGKPISQSRRKDKGR